MEQERMMTGEPEAGREPSAGTGGPRLHGELLAASLLALLRGWNAYGYQLAQRLRAAGLPFFDQTTVYRTLRQLEKSGLVSSFWDTSASGPARRRYALTQAGEAFLAAWLETLQRYQQFLQALWGIAPPSAGEQAGRRPAQAQPEHRGEDHPA
jgi:PadR family transcriptional regulator PadR